MSTNVIYLIGAVDIPGKYTQQGINTAAPAACAEKRCEYESVGVRTTVNINFSFVLVVLITVVSVVVVMRPQVPRRPDRTGFVRRGSCL